MLPFFTRLEADAEFGSEPWHGASGPMRLQGVRGRRLDPACDRDLPQFAGGERRAARLDDLDERPGGRRRARAGPPVIELPALADPHDVERLAEGYRVALEVANRPELREVCSGPAPAAPEGDLAEFIRGDAYSLPHVVGTCAIGTVVDTLGHVREVEGLTVADASIMPDVPSGFTHWPAIMLAERLSEQIAP